MGRLAVYSYCCRQLDHATQYRRFAMEQAEVTILKIDVQVLL